MESTGKFYSLILIGLAGEPPVQVGSITIETDPLLVEDWMLEKVSIDAIKQLTNFVIKSNEGKVIN